MILKRLAILFVVALIAAACGAGTDEQAGDEGGDPPAPTVTLPSTTAPPTTEAVSDDHDEDADHAEGEADHHDEGADQAESEADHHDEDADHAEGETDHHDDAELVADRTVEIVMTEWAYVPDDLTAKAGETVEFVVTNDGQIQHEFRLTTEHAAIEHIEGGHEGHNEAEASQSGHEHGEVILVVDAGATDSITVKFDEHSDFDVVACLLPDHYEAGMHAPFTMEG